MVVLETCQSPSRKESEEVILRFDDEEVMGVGDERAVSSELIQRLRTMALAIHRIILDI